MNSRWIVYASTVLRGSTNELTGFLISIDWLKRKVIKKIPIPINTNHKYWNARGGNRGGRGIAFDNNNNILYVATATEILIYNMDMKYLGTINHEYMAGIHEILLDRNGIWITSTVHDLVFKISFDGDVLDEWWGSKSTHFNNLFSFLDRDINIKLDFPGVFFEAEYNKYCSEEIFHINALANNRGAIYVLSSSRKSLLRIRPDEKLLLADSTLTHPHNLCITSDEKGLVNDTGNQCIRIYDLLTGKKEKTINTNITRANETSLQFAKAGWQRGLTCIKNNHYLVGSSPAQLFEVNISNNQVVNRMIIDNDVRHCIHGLIAVDI